MATNILGIGIGIANAIGFNKFKMRDIVSLKPIASYRCYDKTNDDADRNVLTDLTGNGHDIQLYNFAFAESSGYGKYAINWLNSYSVIHSRGTADVYNNKIIFTASSSSRNEPTIQNLEIANIPSYKVKVQGIKSEKIAYRYTDEKGLIKYINIYSDGIYNIPASYQTETSRWSGWGLDIVDSCNITIEQIPDYKGALVSDGVDDYGLCKNFPILTKEKGFTICAIRTFSEKGALCSNGGSSNSAFIFEGFNLAFNIYSFGRADNVNLTEKLFTYMTSINYNGQVVKKR